MSYKTVLIVLIAFIFIGLVGYKIISFLNKMEVNTVSPQCSKNIETSKKENLFIAEYYLTKNENANGSAWIEYVWKNTFNDKDLVKEKFDGYQLIIKKSVLEEKGFLEKDFINKWLLNVPNNQLQGSGSGNGNYLIYLAKKETPQKIIIDIVSKKDTTKNISKQIIDSIILYKMN
jgi:hypothetical protein